MDPSATTSLKPKVCRNGAFCLGGVFSDSNIEWIPSQPWGSTFAQKCSEGTYCQAGAYFSSGTGLCYAGHYCPSGKAFPISTPLGNYAAGLGSVAPTLCFPGTYAPLLSQVNCIPCPSGHTCASYGTYKPSICPIGTYRSQVDSVTCNPCPTATYSYDVGVPDLSLCLPCPQGRVCPIKQMTNLNVSTDCPSGYLCGYGTDRSNQFIHLAPAGFTVDSNTSPLKQYGTLCDKGTNNRILLILKYIKVIIALAELQHMLKIVVSVPRDNFALKEHLEQFYLKRSVHLTLVPLVDHRLLKTVQFLKLMFVIRLKMLLQILCKISLISNFLSTIC